MDMEAMMKWSSAKIIRYQITGIYKDSPGVSSDRAGRGDVSDRVEIVLKWDLAQSKMVGTPTIKNSPSTVTNLRDAEPKCLPPIMKGPYEHFELLSLKEGMGGALEMQVKTTYPVVEVAQSCRASRKTVPAKVNQRPEEFVVPSPVMFAMPLPKSDSLSATPDKKSFIIKKSGWTWTVTPSIDS